MIKWQDIPDLYKVGAVLVAATAFVLTYHDQFITEAEAMEQQRQLADEIKLLRVDRYEDKLERKVDDKSAAIKNDDDAEAEKLQQEIDSLRDKIERTCEQIEDGCL